MTNFHASASRINMGLLKGRFWYLFISFVYFVFLFPSPDYTAFNKDDSSFFSVFAQNLSRYGRYSLDCFPLDNWGRHGTWPPVFPLFLTLPTIFFGLNWWVLKLLMVILSLASLLSIEKLLGRLCEGDQDSQWIPKVTVYMTALSPFFFLFSHVTMTEIPFILATSISLLSILRMRGFRTSLMAGVSCGFAFWIRGYAILFIPVIAFYLLTKREWNLSRRLFNTFVCLTPMALSIVGWWVGSKAFVEGHPIDGITERYGTLAGLSSALDVLPSVRAKQCLWWHFPNVAHHFFPFLTLDFMSSHFFATLLGVICFLWIFFGGVVCMRRGDRLIVPWLATGISFLVFTGMGNLRYSLTYLPFIYYLHWIATDAVLKRTSLYTNARNAVVLIPLLLVGLGLGSHLWNPDKLRFITPFWKDYSNAMVWCSRNLPKNAVIVCQQPHTSYGASGLRSLSFTDDFEAFLGSENRETATELYIIFDKTDQKSLVASNEFLHRYRQRSEAVTSEPDVVFTTERLDIKKIGCTRDFLFKR